MDDRFEKTAVDICGAKHPTGWWITCQLEPDHFGEHVRDCAPVEVGERLMFSQYTVHWQDPCECDSHTGVGEDLWKCDECGEVVRYVDDPNGGLTLTELHPYRNRKGRQRRTRETWHTTQLTIDTPLSIAGHNLADAQRRWAKKEQELRDELSQYTGSRICGHCNGEGWVTCPAT